VAALVVIFLLMIVCGVRPVLLALGALVVLSQLVPFIMMLMQLIPAVAAMPGVPI